MKAMRKIGGILLSVSLLLTGISVSAVENNAHPVPGVRVYVGNHLMHIYCVGSGSPTVILDSGLGGSSLDWARVQPEVAKYTRVCAYDRAGYGWSDASPMPRTSLVLAEELHTLLTAARVPGPYVLVGHSFGGFNARMFASRFPHETAALVLVDAAHERQFTSFETAPMPLIAAPRSRNFVLFAQPSLPPGVPQELQPLARDLAVSRSTLSAVRGELAAFRYSAEQVAHAGPLPDIPLAVITRGKRVWPRTPRGDQMERLWEELQDDLARLTSRSIHLVAEHSGHYVQLEQPAVVINTIYAMVQATRPANSRLTKH